MSKPMIKDEGVVLRNALVDAMRGDQAHLDFDAAVKDFPAELRAATVAGAPHTAWQLLEHMRIAQNDILEFSRNPSHKSPEWPEGYWPKADAPPEPYAWDKCVRDFYSSAREPGRLVQEPPQDLC